MKDTRGRVGRMRVVWVLLASDERAMEKWGRVAVVVTDPDTITAWGFKFCNAATEGYNPAVHGGAVEDPDGFYLSLQKWYVNEFPGSGIEVDSVNAMLDALDGCDP